MHVLRGAGDRLKKYLGTHHISKILGVQWSEPWPDTLYKVEDKLYVSCISYDKETSPVPGRPLWVLEAVDGEVPLDSIYWLAWNIANIEGGKNRKGLCSISKLQCRQPCILNHKTEKSNTRSVGYKKKKMPCGASTRPLGRITAQFPGVLEQSCAI